DQRVCTILLKSGFYNWEEVVSEVSEDDITAFATTDLRDSLIRLWGQARSGSLRGPIWDHLISTAIVLQRKLTALSALQAGGYRPRQVPGWLMAQAETRGAASILRDLADSVGSLRYNCVAVNSLKQYATGFRCYLKFAASVLKLDAVKCSAGAELLPARDDIVSLWLSTFTNQDTAKCYLTHLRKWHDWLDLEKAWDSVAVRQTAQGLSKNPRASPAEKPRVSLYMLREMTKLAISRGLIDFSLAAILGYHFLLRIPSELLVARVSQLSVGEVSGEVALSIPKRKNLPAGDRQVRSCCCKTDSLTCPVEASKVLLERRASRDPEKDQLFPLLSYRAFLFILRTTLSSMKVKDAEYYGSHSLRRGAASDLAKSGSSFQQICALGSWRSRVPASVYVDLAEVQKLASSHFMSLLEESDSEAEVE
ncbi:hypothetical protein FOL47_003080, partial [Perkinsus chesapeaki]